jgi:hypothetical protein
MHDHDEITMRRTFVGHIRLGVVRAHGSVILGVLAVGLASSPPSAFAAAPETPETKEATPITGTTATLHGALNPKKTGEAGEYDFTYKQSATECAPEGTLAPEPPATALGAENEAVSLELTGLEPSKPYTFCVVAIHAGASSTGTPVTFKTRALKPVVESESASAEPTQTGVILEALVNPNNQATTCKFEYGTSETLGSSLPCEPATLEGFREAHASANLTGLTPNTIYYYRAAVENATGQAEAVPVKELRTAPPPPTATTGEASGVTSTSATITATVNPGSTGPNSETSYVFEYGRGENATPSSLVECLIAHSSCFLSPPLPGGNAGQGTSDAHETEALVGLQPFTTYHYRIVAYNGSLSHVLFGGGASVVGTDAELTTLPEAPAVIADPPVSLTANSAILSGEVVPQCVEGRYPPTTYRFEYGTTASYSAGSEETAVAASSCVASGEVVTASLPGLAPNTVYHFRLEAKNSGGETKGRDGTFTTADTSQPGSTLPAGFSLTGTAPAGPTAVTFPDLAGSAPTPPASSGTQGSTSGTLTSARRLSNALKACKKDKSKAKRTRCERKAHRRYGSKAKGR